MHKPKAKAQATKPRQRDAEATRAKILKAAKIQFAKNGLSGARVDTSALAAGANKRMIYHYFGSKEALFREVLEVAYLDIRQAEQCLPLDQLAPVEAVETLIRFTWEYYLQNPEFITLVNSENLHRARHLKTSEAIRQTSGRLVASRTQTSCLSKGSSHP